MMEAKQVESRLKMNVMGGKVDTVEVKADAMKLKLEVEGKVNAVVCRVNSLEGKADAVESKVDTLFHKMPTRPSSIAVSMGTFSWKTW